MTAVKSESDSKELGITGGQSTLAGHTDQLLQTTGGAWRTGVRLMGEGKSGVGASFVKDRELGFDTKGPARDLVRGYGELRNK